MQSCYMPTLIIIGIHDLPLFSGDGLVTGSSSRICLVWPWVSKGCDKDPKVRTYSTFPSSSTVGVVKQKPLQEFKIVGLSSPGKWLGSSCACINAVPLAGFIETTKGFLSIVYWVRTYFLEEQDTVFPLLMVWVLETTFSSWLKFLFG